MSNSFPSQLKSELCYIVMDNDLSTERKIERLITTLLENDISSSAATAILHGTVARTCSAEIARLARVDSGLHFTASKITEAKLHEFDLGQLGQQMQAEAPHTWNLMDSLYLADPQRERRREITRRNANEKAAKSAVVANRDGDIAMNDMALNVAEDDDELSDYWNEVEAVAKEKDVDAFEAICQVEEQHKKHVMIRKIVGLSVMLQTTNQRCNALQTFIGVFLQATNCPETLRELLSRLGISISVTTINKAVNSLSKDADKAIEGAFDKLLALLALDNVDVNLPHSIETTNEPSLVHLTSGTIIPLSHGIQLSDLDCSEELWSKSPSNLAAVEAGAVPKIETDRLLTLFMDNDTPDANGLQQRDRFNAWKFLHDLIYNGPAYFTKFKKNLGDPEEFDCIPVTKTTQVPCRTQKIHPATPAENAEAIEGFFKQAKVGDPSDKTSPGVRSLGNYVALCYGDLLTGQHIRSVLDSRGQEGEPWRRMQHVVYVMGLFHLKMAAADAIWRIFIHPKKTRTIPDENSLITHAGILRPRETGKIESKPGFRRMHEVIQHTGIVARLDCWRLEVLPACQTLDDFASTEPTWEVLQSMAISLSKKFGSHPEITEEQHSNPKRDEQYGNMLLRHEYFLLYEELSYAMNHGDVGRVERCMIPWMFIFSGCGKHKYAAELRRYLENMHFIYPEGLRKAIRMSILANPTGKRDAFRAIDWIVEHNNLYTKRIYGGKYSNHQLDRIIAESPLIEVYKNTRRQLETMFCLESYTARHSPPDLSASFKKLAHHMVEQKTNVNTIGQPKRRTSNHPVLDIIDEGMDRMVMSDSSTVGNDEEEEEEEIDNDMDDDGSMEV